MKKYYLCVFGPLLPGVAAFLFILLIPRTLNINLISRYPAVLPEVQLRPTQPIPAGNQKPLKSVLLI